MKPIKIFKSDMRGILTIFSFIPLSLLVLSVISRLTNPSIGALHFFIVLPYILLLTICLYLLAYIIAWQKVEIYEEKIVIKKVLRKKSLLFTEFKTISEEKKKSKYGTMEADFISIQMNNLKEITIPIKPFEKEKETLLLSIKKENRGK